jgi:hypothetical protein
MNAIMKISTALKALAGAAVVMLPLTATAESTFSTGAAALSSSARVDFQVTIPKILYLRVGAGSAYPGTLATVGTIDAVTFSPAAGVVGNGSAVSGAGGDLTGGVSTAAIISNSGNVTLNAVAAGAGLSDGAAGDFIPFTQITTTAAALTGGWTLLPAPILINGTSANVVLTAPATKVITADARWTFAYANTTTPPAGTYGGVNTNNSRVTYTATMP